MENSKMPKVYTALWSVIVAAYTVFMIVMRKVILFGYATEAERTVKIGEAAARSSTLKWYRASDAVDDVYVIFDQITGLTTNLEYVIWAVISIVALILYPIAIARILYGKDPGKGLRIISEVLLIAGFVYITYYALIGDYTILDKVKNITASMLGLSFPIRFKIWGILTAFSIFINYLYAARKLGFIEGGLSKAAVIIGSLGCAAIYVTINVPSAGLDLIPDSARCLAHWSGALIFAFFEVAMLAFLLFNYMRRGDKRFKLTFIIFIATMAVMAVLLVAIGKSALIENLPVWVAYIILFLLNFTKVFDKKTAE